MAFEPTNEQQSAIEARGTILVCAAAGSGKTAVLTERVISRMLDTAAPVDADRLLIVTFTNAAAAEMKSRIEKRLAQEHAKSPENTHINRQLLLMSNAMVTTIDSFCIALVRENFDRLNIPPDFKIADAETAAPISEQVLSRIIAKEFAGGSEAFFALLEALGDEYGEGTLREMILKIFDSSSSMPFAKKWRAQCVERYQALVEGGTLGNSEWGRVILNEVAACCEAICEKASTLKTHACTHPFLQRTYLPALEYVLEAADHIRTAAAAGEWDTVREAILSLNIPSTKPPLKKEGIPVPEDAAAFKLRWLAVKNGTDRLRKLCESRMATDEATQLCLAEKSLPILRKIIEMTDEYDDNLLAELLKKNLLTFSYTEQLALSLFLDENGEPQPNAEQLRGRFDEVLVDEYQDTNQLQDTLFAAISGDHLFTVGDVKQSIYRFRHADPDGFLEKKNRYAPYASADEHTPRKIILGKNFRSRKGVCDFVNHCFESWMRTDTCGMEYGGEDALLCGAQFPENDGQDVQAVLLSYDKNEYSRIEAEAYYIAERIRSIMAAGDVIRDEADKNRLRPARYGDFAILLRSLSGKADVYCEILRKCGIPVSAQSSEFFETVEISTFLSCIKAIANPTRDIPLAGAMCSPIFGFTADELAKLRAENKAGSLYLSVCAAAEGGDEKAAALLARLKFYRDKSASMTVDRFLLFLLEDTGYLACATAMTEGLRRRERLFLLVDKAKSLADSGGMSLSEFCVKMDRLSQGGGAKIAPGVAGGDCVRIMTIHASKGLQFPVCILANLSGKLNQSDMSENLLLSEALGIGFRYFDDRAAVRYSSAARDAIAIQAGQAGIAEELRLLYVAMTRAEEKLILLLATSGEHEKLLSAAENELTETNGALSIPSQSILEVNNYAKWFYLLLAMHPEYHGVFERECVSFDGITLIHATPVKAELQPSDAQPHTAPKREAVDALRERFAYQYPYAALNSIIAKTGASRLAELDHAGDYSFTAVPSFMSETGLTPAERGTAAHKFLQYAEFKQNADAGCELARLVAAGTLRRIEAEAIDLRRMQRFFDSDIFARILRSPRVMREVRFLDELPASDFVPDLPSEVAGEAVIVQGIADCVFEEDGALVILDYKTDHVDCMAQLVERYSRQLKIYAAVCEKTYNMPVKACVIYSLRLGESISFS